MKTTILKRAGVAFAMALFVAVGATAQEVRRPLANEIAEQVEKLWAVGDKPALRAYVADLKMKYPGYWPANLSGILVTDLLDQSVEEVEKEFEAIVEEIENGTLVRLRPGRDASTAIPMLMYFFQSDLGHSREVEARSPGDILKSYVRLLRQTDKLLSQVDIEPWLEVCTGKGDWMALSETTIMAGNSAQRPLYVDRASGEMGCLAEDFTLSIQMHKFPGDKLANMLDRIHRERGSVVPEFVTGLAPGSDDDLPTQVAASVPKGRVSAGYCMSRYLRDGEHYRVVCPIRGFRRAPIWHERIMPAGETTQVVDEAFDVAEKPSRAIFCDARRPNRLFVVGGEPWSVERVLTFAAHPEAPLPADVDEQPVIEHLYRPAAPPPAPAKLVPVKWTVSRIARASWVVPGAQVFVVEEGMKRAAIVTVDGEVVCAFPGRDMPADRLFLANGPGYIVAYDPTEKRLVLVDASHRDIGSVSISMDTTKDKVAVAGREVLAIFRPTNGKISFYRLIPRFPLVLGME